VNAGFISALLLRSLFGADGGSFDLNSLANKPPDFTQLVKDAVRQMGNCPSDEDDDAVLVCGKRRQSYRIEPEMLKSMRGERSRYDRYRLGGRSTRDDSSLPPRQAILDQMAR